MFRRIGVLLGAAVVSFAATGAGVHRVPVRIDPPQAISAITIRSGDITQPVVVRNGIAQVPVNVPLPWSLGMMRFESHPYTRADLDQKRAWVIREFGSLRGRLERPSPKAGERFYWLLRTGEASPVTEKEFTADEQGSFEINVPAGTYEGAILGGSTATRIRSGIVVKPGQGTDLGVLSAERTTAVSLRVVDGKTGEPLSGARVMWDPPGDVLNATPSRNLFARRWSGVTNRYGLAEIPSVGPLPHSVRWSVEAKDYAPTQSVRVQLKEPRRVVLPDVALRQKPAVIVRVQYPKRDEEGLKNSTLVAGEMRDPQSPRFEAVSRTKLREGDLRFDFHSYGRKRVWIENASKRILFYRDVDIKSETTLIDLTLQPVEVHGRVTHRGKGVDGALVTIADPKDARVILAQSPSDKNGEYRVTTWQAGKLFLYTIGPKNAPGRRTGRASATVDVADRGEVRVDLEIPPAGFSIAVIDGASGAPLQAHVELLARTSDGGAIVSSEETDDDGRLEVSGFEEGTAKLHVEARGYRAADLELSIDADRPEATVRLERANPIGGRVITVRGAPVPGAKVLGGYSSELADFGFYSTSTDAEGRFRFDNPPDPKTPFYVIAAGYALATSTLPPDQSATIVVHPPSAATVTLRESNRPPEKVFLVMAAPRGGENIPLEVIDTLAQINGMDLYQVSGSSVDGDVILPQFLGPGTYDLFLARRGGNPFNYERVGSVTTPLARPVVLSLR